MNVEFFVPGTPRPKGSKRHVGHGRMIEMSKHLPAWRTAVGHACRKAMRNRRPIPTTRAVGVVLEFRFPRPKAHYRTGRFAGQLKPNAPIFHLQRPDIDKLERAILDACTGIAFVDDSQVISVTKRKGWGDESNAGVRVSILDVTGVAADEVA